MSAYALRSDKSWTRDDVRRIFLTQTSPLYPEIPPEPLINDAFPTSFTSSGGPNLATQVLLQNSSLETGQRASIVQQCLRYWDIDNVGDGRHLSFFEMAVMVSVGWGRREILRRLYWILTDPLRGFGIEPTRLWATVYGQGLIHGLEFAPDSDAANIWSDLGIEAQQMEWVHGSEGFVANRHESVGGYRTEIYFARATSCRGNCQECLPGSSTCGRFVELATSVTYDCEVGLDDHVPVRRLGGPPVIAAGLGLERVLQVVSGEHDISCVGLSRTMRQVVLDAVGDDPSRSSVRLGRCASRIADHLRALAFLASTTGLKFPGKANKHRRPIINRYRRQLCEALLYVTSEDSSNAFFITEEAIKIWLATEEGRIGRPRGLTSAELASQILNYADSPRIP